MFVDYSVIAALGLAENSSVVLVASMLVSPLMVDIYCIHCTLRFQSCQQHALAIYLNYYRVGQKNRTVFRS